MSERNIGIPGRENNDSPHINTRISQDKTLITPPSSQSPAFQAERQPKKRKKRKGNNWTRKKLPSRTTIQHSDLLSAPATESKEEDNGNDEAPVAVKSEGMGDLTADLGMDIRRAAVERDFGLRPGRSLGIMDRPKLPTKSTAEASPVSPERGPPPDVTKNSPVRPPRAVFSMIPAPEAQEIDREATISPTDQRGEDSTSSRDTLTKRRLSDDSQTGDENPMIPSHFPPNPITRPDRACNVFWRNACMEVQRPDGSVHAPDVIRRLMTKQGGIARPWPQLEEGLAAIEAMKKDTIDLAEIFSRQEEEEANARAKEERRLANKRRYRPRGQIDRERAERQAALATLKTKELESDGASTNHQESSA